MASEDGDEGAFLNDCESFTPAAPTGHQRSRARFVERTLVVHGLMRRFRERVPSTQLRAIGHRLWVADVNKEALRYRPEQLAELVGTSFFETLGVEAAMDEDAESPTGPRKRGRPSRGLASSHADEEHGDDSDGEGSRRSHGARSSMAGPSLHDGSAQL
jgi:hypothetical protein